MKYYVGVDHGGTNIVAGVVDENYKIIVKHSQSANVNDTFEKSVESIASTAFEAVSKASLSMSDITGIGIGTPGTVDPKTDLLSNSNNFDWKKKPFTAEVKKHIKEIPIFIDNDANCAALGEALAGVARQYDSAVMLTLGTGVGGGIILNKTIFSGCDKMGAELGHSIIELEGAKCTCGMSGCLEAYASATGLIRQIKEAMQNHPESVMHEICGRDMGKVEAKTAFDAMAQGDKIAAEVIDRYTTYLAVGIGSFVSIFRPDIVIIGGGVSNAGDALLKPLNQKIPKYVFGAAEIGAPKAVVAELGNDAGLIGAAMLVEMKR